jgi:hypothetical protein
VEQGERAFAEGRSVEDDNGFETAAVALEMLFLNSEGEILCADTLSFAIDHLRSLKTADNVSE